jgi:hypothetical protein
MPVTLAPGERIIIEAMQRGDKLTAVFMVTPAFAKLTDSANEDSIVALGDVLGLENLGLIIRSTTDPVAVDFDLTEAGKAWTEEVTPPEQPTPTPTPTPTVVISKTPSFFMRYKYPLMAAAAVILFIIVYFVAR